MLSKLKKLRGRSFDELRVRGQQGLSALAERRGWSSQTKLPSDSGLLSLLTLPPANTLLLLERFRTGSRPAFFTGMSDRKSTVDLLTKKWSEAAERITRRADLFAAGKFDLMGYRDLSFGDPIDWHLEPTTNRRSPLVHWSRVDELDSRVGGDQKIVRELSRHQYFITLGQAYWLTGDERYAEAFTTHLASWMNKNSPKIGTHWGSSLEIAFRSVSWLWGFHFFKDSPSLTPELFASALRFFYLNGRHIETYLSTYYSPNTHLTGEALGLFYLGTLLQEFREAKRWRTIGRQILLEQLHHHVRPDGVYFEQSSYYHRYTTDFYTHFLILAELNGEELPVDIASKLEALMVHLMYITRPDGTTPFFGDDDGGRLLFLDSSETNDFGSVLSNGAVLFKRSDFKFVAKRVREETLWLLGPEGLREYEEVPTMEPAQQSIGFRDSGYYVMRDNWTSSANYLLFDCGPHGGSSCGHAHADALSIELVAYGRRLLVDPGTYTYTGSKELRDWFRSSAAHNTLTVDGKSSSVVEGPFSWSAIARSECNSWLSQNRFDFVDGIQNGYQRLPDPVIHNRSILFLKNDYWIMRDSVKAVEKHKAELHFHFEFGLKPELGQSENQTISLSETGLKVTVFGSDGGWRKEDSWVSHCYGSREPATSFVFSTYGNDIITFLLPQKVGISERPSVQEIEAVGGRGFEVSHSAGVDVVMLCQVPNGHVETARLSSDFLWTWARFSNDEEATPIEVILLSGTTLQLEGRQILKTNRPLEYVVARRVGDRFTVETDDGFLDLTLPAADFATAFSRLSNSEVRN